MPPDPLAGDALEATAHLVQMALTPVFLLSGIGTLLGTFATRLGRVADRVDHLLEVEETCDPERRARIHLQLEHLQTRSHLLDWAVLFGALAGGSACGATLCLFVGVVGARETASLLYGLLGIALLCTLVAITLFLFEVLLANRGIRNRAERVTGEAMPSTERREASDAAPGRRGRR